MMPRTLRRIPNLLTPFGWQLVGEAFLVLALVGALAR